MLVPKPVSSNYNFYNIITLNIKQTDLNEKEKENSCYKTRLNILHSMKASHKQLLLN